MFDRHVEDFRRAENDCKEAVMIATTAADKPQMQEKQLHQAQDYLLLCEKAVEAMSNELRTAPGSKGLASSKAKQHRAELASLKRTVKELENSVQRSKLLGDEGKHTTARQRLLDTSDRLAEGTRGIDSARRVALETEEIGIDVMSDLRGQRDVILRTRNHMVEIDGSLDQSRATLRAMGKKVLVNKVMLLGIIAVLLATLIFLLYIKLHHHRS
eukprot:GEMP01054911.1.p1 GENE.GEMP01054911.1~~GEMP01054911.1.p1  ORF type:complete len:214 (+),score=47.49 GEMP01054911.1:308-949(+)